ncbi:autotransporter domain-containing protein [Achromobacter kerstersii]|uniref:autotransporter domain-containing protein n=1 Tax=Achromobacter kerstersii TaxID=1353890 RepID=UPI001FE1B409|nr:autotransporter domain-containing protein [Achromobacter kerstersii]
MPPAAMAQTIVGSGDIFPGSPGDWGIATDFIVGNTATGTLRIDGGAWLNNTNGVLGNGAGATGTVDVSGLSSGWVLGESLSVGREGTGTLNVVNYGRVQVLGAGIVSLAEAATARGTINIGAIPGAAPATVGEFLAKEVHFGAGTAKLNFNTNGGVDFAASLSSDSAGIHELNHYSGTTTLRADSNGFLGQINVIGGELQIRNKLGSSNTTIDNLSGAAISAAIRVDGSNAVWANDGNLFVGSTSKGALTVSNGAQVNNLFGTVSAQQNGVSEVTVLGAGSVWRNSHALSVGGQGGQSGQGKVFVDAGGGLFSSDAYIGSSANSVGAVTVSGFRSSWRNDGNLRVGDISGQGSLSVLAGAMVSNQIALIGSMGGTGKVTVSGAGSEWFNSGSVAIGYGVGVANGTLTIANLGTATVGASGTQAVELVSSGISFLPSTATINIGGEVGSVAVLGGTLNASEIKFGAGFASLNFNHTDTGLNFATPLRSLGSGSGSGLVQHRLNQVAGTTVLTGNSAAFTGKTTVSGGKLVVLDKLGGTADVSGGTLQYGDGTTGAANLLSGNLNVAGNLGTLSIQGPATLQVAGDVVMADNTTLALGAGTGGPALQAAAVSLGNGTVLNLSGITGPIQQEMVLMDTQGGIQGDFAAVNISGFTSAVDYLTLHTGKSADSLKYLASYDLSWTAKNSFRHGTFTLTQPTDSYTVGVALNDQVANASTGWNGTTLTKAGEGTLVLTGNNTYTGGTEIRLGTLSVSKDANLGAAGTAVSMMGGTLATTADFSSNRQLNLLQNSTLDVASGTQLDWTGAVTGSGTLTKDGAGTVTLWGVNNQTNTVVQAGTLIGNSASIRGNLLNHGSVVFNQLTDGTITGLLLGTGSATKLGAGSLTLGARNVLDWDIQAGTLISDASRYAADAKLGAAGTLRFDQTTDNAYAGTLSGSGTFEKTGAGALQLSADNSAFSGTTRVRDGVLTVSDKLGGNADITGGHLQVMGTLNGNALIRSGGVLSGSGTIGQDATLVGGVLQGAQGLTLTIGGNLTLNNAGQINVALGTASSTALFDVGGDLALAGTLNVTDQGAFGPGVYRLFDYGGALTAQTLALGTTPAGISNVDLRLQTAVAGQVNLMSTAGATLSFWDGDNAAQRDNGVINGGSGLWRTDGLNWTNQDGTLNGRFQPNPTFAVFQGASGIVSVDAGAGAVGVTGMQFTTSGYRVQGDAIALSGVGGETIVRVGSGQPTSAGTTATLASRLTGASKLVKSDFGTLVLAGANSYTGGTEIRGGTLSISSDDHLGASAGGLTLNGGALATTASFDSTRAMTLTQTADINVAAGTTLGWQGAIGGTGNLQKLGAGTLTLTGANTYGNTQVLAGTLVGNAGSIRGDLLNNSAAVFNQTTDAVYAGYVSGTGTTAKQGVGMLTLTGVNAQDWRIDAGTLAVSAGGYTSNTTIALGADLRFNQTSSASFSGVLAGAGQVTKTGAGTLELVGDSSAFAGQTQVQSGTLRVSNTLGGSASVTGGRLQTDGVLAGDVTASGAGIVSGAGHINGSATLSGGVLEGVQGQTLAIGGDLSLSSTSQVNVELGNAPNTALFRVADNLTLAGSLNITDQGGFGAGVYRLFDYGGTLTNNGLAIGATPNGVAARDLALQTAVSGQVNLASTSGATLGFWDGSNTARHDNGVIDGGSGTWRADGRNWANVDGTLNGVFQPNPTFAVFQGTAGTVTVDNSAGAIGVTGMQIAADGYRIEGDAIALQGAGGESIIRVGSGTTADVGMTGTIAASLTGASKLAKTDFGTLVLTGNNTYTGGTDVRAGTLTVAKDVNLGAAAGGLTLSGGTLSTTASFDTARSVLVTQSSRISVASETNVGLTGSTTGNGDLAKTGAGTLTVSGDGSAYTGSLLVQAGALNIASAGKLGGALTMANGTMLQGTGQVGSTLLQSGAILAPGNVAGTLNVAGDLTFMPGSVYQVAADPASSASARVAVSGAANLAGSVVHVGPEGGFESTRQYTILSAGVVNGQFDNVSSNYAYLAPALRYGAQDVTLQLGRKLVPVNPVDPGTRPIAFADAAQTRNQRAVANALDSLPSGNALHEFILTLPNGAPPAVFNNLSGEAHASVASSLMGSSTTTRTLPLSHLRANLNAGMRPGAPTAQAGGTLSASALPSSNAQPAWAELVGNWQTQNATDNTAQVRQHTGGVFAGADHAVGNGWRVGGAVGYTDSKIRVDDLASKADVSGYSAAIYGGKSFDAGTGKLNLLVGTSYTWHDVNTERYATVAGASQKLTADYGASTTQLFTELGYAMPLSDRTTLEPFAGVAWSDLRSRSFQETGGSAALTGQSSSDKQTSSTLGVRAQTDFTLAGAEGRLRGTLGWRHAFGDVLPQSTMAFDGGQAFTVAGAPIARNAAVAELGAEVAVSRNASLGLNYSGQYGGGNREHAGSLNVRWRY